jgi:hypothetical protein
MFSGDVPFHDAASDFRVMQAVMDSKRPPRPSDDLCRIRGLDNAIWIIIETCWAQDPQSRLTSEQIVKHLRASPTLAVDKRPVDHFDPSFPSRTLYSQAEHPFSALRDSMNDGRW